MSKADETYSALLRQIVESGDRRSDRTGTGTLGIFGCQLRFDLSEEFPLLTTKRLHWKSIVEELLWFLSGSTSVRPLQEKGVSIWDEWADPETGELGPVYGKQWRDWTGVASNGKTLRIDQIKALVEGLQKDPFSRRHIVSAWNPIDIPDMALPPCHCLFQLHVTPDGRLNCQLYQRSADVFLGLPFNIASYSLLTLMIAQVSRLRPGSFVWTGGDTHLYLNHVEQAQEQLSRLGRAAPSVSFNHNIHNLFDFRITDIDLVGYDPHPPIKAKVAV